MSLNTIREVTEIIGITVNALRYYDSKGILHPTVRSSGGRKEWLYDDEAIRKAKRILLLRSVGIPVENIDYVLEKADKMDEMMLKSRLKELQAEREALDKQIAVAGMLLMIDDLPADSEIKDDLLDRMFEKACRESDK